MKDSFTAKDLVINAGIAACGTKEVVKVSSYNIA
jgi:hypothetical protein